MASGYLYKGQCYATLAAASSAKWTDSPPAVTPNTTSYLSDITWSGTAWVINKYTLTSTGTLTKNSTTALPALTFETCDTMGNFSDGMALGWGVAFAMVCAWAIRTQRLGL